MSKAPAEKTMPTDTFPDFMARERERLNKLVEDWRGKLKQTQRSDALQDTALKAWGGAAANFAAAQKEFAKRARLNGLASTGGYAPDMESQAA